MLTVVKNQIKISFLSVKYALIKESLNKVTFITSILFMILNNSSFIIQWIIFFSLKDNIGGYNMNKVLLLWALAASTFGFSHFFFKNSYNLSSIITNGKLDAYLVIPKNVLLSAITTDVESSALGDMLYGYIVLFITGITIPKFLLFTIFTITGGLIMTSFAVILGSLSFWLRKSDTIADIGNSFITHFATYPEGIFKDITRILLYTIIPIGIVSYIPIKIINEFNPYLTIIIGLLTIVLVIIAFIIFNRGLKRYSSSNLMIARI